MSASSYITAIAAGYYKGQTLLENIPSPSRSRYGKALMSNGKNMLRTSSGFEAVLSLIRSDTAIVLDSTAVPSAATHEFDAVSERALERYREAPHAKESAARATLPFIDRVVGTCRFP